jgi:hypothetical protein
MATLLSFLIIAEDGFDDLVRKGYRNVKCTVVWTFGL